MPHHLLRAVALVVVAAAAQSCRSATEHGLARLDLPEGFTAGVYSADVPGARSLALGAQGTVFVGSRGAGNVYALRDTDGDGRTDHRHLLIEGSPDSPNGVAFLDGDLYVAFTDRIARLPAIESRLDDPPAPQTVARLPRYDHHGWRYLAAGPDGALYVGLGAPCNVCERYGEIWRVDPDNGKHTVIARGVRNTVGFDWSPQTGTLWFTDNGRDMLGDNRPPDELNRLTGERTHFGFPYCHGGDIPDPEYGSPDACARYVPPVQRLGPHVAALGMRFYDGDAFPADYRGDILIAEHGSWNRSERIGYRLMRVDPEAALAGTGDAYRPFVTGWLTDSGEIWGRPVDVLVLPSGALLVSDDYRGAVYHIDYGPPG
ncbi:sorbosone dehydrogenase family protein [Arhodomonas sp. KWT2]|uniref:PQQ-dependent sugar dehydrogenase n=1 Tax=unclassified Arhodomonas TaxID=2621637 RepID=UPI0013D54154|nr:PQQ-dependent sugar dehydrogenase [Arhodomonas sp. KWT]